MSKNYCAVLVEDCVDCEGEGYIAFQGRGGGDVCIPCAGKGKVWTPVSLVKVLEEVLPELSCTIHGIILDIEERSHD